MNYPIISADSHITEHPNTYIDNIDPKWKDKAPVLKNLGEKGDVFVIDGMKRSLPMGLIAAAGKPAEELRTTGSVFEDFHRGGWDPEARMEDQKKDGVAAEILYPTVGMALSHWGLATDFEIVEMRRAQPESDGWRRNASWAGAQAWLGTSKCVVAGPWRRRDTLKCVVVRDGDVEIRRNVVVRRR